MKRKKSVEKFVGLKFMPTFALEIGNTRWFTVLIRFRLGSYQSGQMGQTVNLLAYAFGGSNPSLPTLAKVGNCGNSSIDRALAFQAGGCGFEPRFPLK